MDSIKARILGILGVLAFGYLLLLAMVQFTAAATHRHIEEASGSLFPAALRLQEAEASFEHLQKRYKEAVLLEDAGALDAAEKDADAVSSALSALRPLVAGSPDLARSADALVASFAGIRIRSHESYAAMLASKDGISDGLPQQAAALAVDDAALAASMATLDKAVAAHFREQLSYVDQWSRRSRTAGWAMLLMALIGCAVAWSVLKYKVFVPLYGLARRMQDIA